MDQLNSINYVKYPKSLNHKITWTKKNNIKTCDLNPNCMELTFDIKKNKNIKIINDNIKIINDNQPLLDKLPDGDLPIYEMFSSNPNWNYDVILIVLVIIFVVTLLNKKL